MPRSSKNVYECIECGTQYIRWQGQCDQCQGWNTLEGISEQKSTSKHDITRSAIKINDVKEPEIERFQSGFEELDRVLGRGWVHGSVNLICGEPGIGKSTIVLQSILQIQQSAEKILYITAEESEIQVKQRAKRLSESISDKIYIVADTEMESIIELIYQMKPSVVILDSIQMVISHKLNSMPGSLNQVRMCASMFIKAIKDIGSVGVLVGHITKDGQLAGPKMLEHMVDVILFFEGERSMSIRMLRALKNRYGTTNETGLFRMVSTGLKEIKDSQYIISDQSKDPLSGAVFTAILSGTRGMLVEVQSLVVQAGYQQSKRTFVGVDAHRAHLMIAILDKYFSLKLSFKDIFVSMVGGLKTQSPDIDLSICFSIWSSYYLRPIPKNIAILGEVGLTGEILSVTHLDHYIGSMDALGIETCIIAKSIEPDWPKGRKTIPIFVSNIFDAYKIFNTISLKEKGEIN